MLHGSMSQTEVRQATQMLHAPGKGWGLIYFTEARLGLLDGLIFFKYLEILGLWTPFFFHFLEDCTVPLQKQSVWFTFIIYSHAVAAMINTAT